MASIHVHGLHPLRGELRIQGSKNAALPMMAAAVLHKGLTVISNIPRIQDVFCMMGILDFIGCQCYLEKNRLEIHSENVTKFRLEEFHATTMRSSIILLGALLGRLGEAETFYPGGCSIGNRPIDLHLTSLKKMGADIVESERLIKATSKGMKGAKIILNFPSVGATENIILAAVLADGETTIVNAAMEPEVIELCRFLNNCGADIFFGFSGKIIINGVKELHDSEYTVMGDRIVAGSYIASVMAAKGEALFENVPIHEMNQVLNYAENAGAVIVKENRRLYISMQHRPKPTDIYTAPYPGFPTDLQSQMMAVMTIAEGCTNVEENIFEGRFKTAYELKKMGADVRINKKYAYITGVNRLHGAEVCATDLRGGAALVTAAFAAEGMTCIDHYEYIKRGYEDICGDLKKLGANIELL